MAGLDKATLAYQFGVRPGTLLRSMTHIPVPQVVEALNGFMDGDTIAYFTGEEGVESIMGSPEVDALIFYMMNHAVSLVRQRVHPYAQLGDYLPVVEEYHRQLAYRSTRMFYYMLLICTRESRHAKSAVDTKQMKEVFKGIETTVKPFWQGIKGTGSSSAVNSFRTHPPVVGMGRYTDYLVDIFFKSSYSSGYGGKAWGAVATVLRDYIHGTISAEMMMDTGFTLCHNNGPIFNKGMLYTSYTEEIYMILDVQRAGMIPQLIGNKESNKAKLDVVQKIWELCYKVFPKEFAGYVDWYLVEKLGAKKSYPLQKSNQVKVYGEPPAVEAKKMAQVIKTTVSKPMPKVDAEKIVDSLKDVEGSKGYTVSSGVDDSKWVLIMPGLKVKKVEMQR